MPAPHFFAEPQALGIDPRRLTALLDRAAREVRDGLLPSAQIAVARHGRLAVLHTVGRAVCGGRESDADNTTLYAVFSATKAITSAAAWLLIEAGRLRLEARVAELLPEFAANGKEAVTVEQLFTHTCGFPSAPFSPLEWEDRATRLARFAHWRLNWAPGTRYEYHPTASMWVIAELVERASGTAFRDFVRQRVALPLGLPDLWLGLPADQQHRVADVAHVGTLPSEEELRAIGFPVIPPGEVTEDALTGFNLPAVRAVGVPGGGATTTAGDLALFYQALLAGGRADDGTAIWRPETIAMAREIRSGALCDPIFAKRANRALGLIVAGDADRTFRGFGKGGSPLAFGHNGAGGQIAWADPASGLSFAYCTNGLDRHPVRQAKRGVALSSLAAELVA